MRRAERRFPPAHGLPLLAALAVLWTCADSGAQNVHPAGWADGAVHGAEVAAGGADQCTTCHGAGYLGGSSGISCYGCHDGPGGHPAGWYLGWEHGRRTFVVGYSYCAACHGEDATGGWSGVSCSDCHLWPQLYHPSGWRNGWVHGDEVMLHGSVSCAECHGYDYQGGTLGVSCYDCHFGPMIIHPGGYFSGGEHGAEVLSGGPGLCANCHGADYKGGSSGVSCFTCHLWASSVREPSASRRLLFRNAPNPFNPRTRISFELPRTEAVTLRVFDTAGRLVETLIAGEVREAGRHEVVWNGRDSGGRSCPSGAYFYRIEAGEIQATRRMVLLK